MGWRESLLDASFRGVPFFVSGHESEVGRRVQVHEYPLRDLPYTEDLGRLAQSFSIDAYVLGTDYMQARDALLLAVEKAGPGPLVHPWLGQLSCTVLRCRLRESTEQGGMARFAIDFIESGDALYPDATASTGASVTAAADDATTVVADGFAERHWLSKKPEFVAAASEAIFKDALNQIQGAVGKVRAVADQVAALNRSIESQQRDLLDLLFQPASAAQAMVANIRTLIRNVTTGPQDALALARVFYRFGSLLPTPMVSTPSRRTVANNQVELLRLVRVTAVAEGARAASQVDFASYQDAIAARDEILDVIDIELEDAPDELFDALRTLRASVVRDAAARDANLARVVAYTPRSTAPALVLAQRLYADATREDELITRNRVRHPLFVPGGHALEVLTDGA